MAALECKKSRKSRLWDVISVKVYLNWSIAHTQSNYRTRVRVAGLGYRSSNVETGNHLEVLKFCKNPKISDTQKICCNHPKSWTRWLFLRVMHPKDAEGIPNSVDPDHSLIWVCTVCSDLSVRKLRKITVLKFCMVVCIAQKCWCFSFIFFQMSGW